MGLENCVDGGPCRHGTGDKTQLERDWPVYFEFVLTVMRASEKPHFYNEMRRLLFCKRVCPMTRSPCNVEEARLGTMGRRKATWKIWNAGEPPWGAGKRYPVKTGALESPAGALESDTL